MTLLAERDRYRAALETLLALRSSVERDRGNDVPLVGNLQARELIERALRVADRPDDGRSREDERAVRRLAEALNHALRDPAIAQHVGWQRDAREALIQARERGVA